VRDVTGRPEGWAEGCAEGCADSVTPGGRGSACAEPAGEAADVVAERGPGARGSRAVTTPDLSGLVCTT
jgi:hypothetical protein